MRTVQFIPSGLVIVIPALVPTVQKRLSSLDQQMEYQKRPVTGMVLAVQSMPFELVMNPLEVMAQSNPSSLDQQTDLYPARGADRAVQAVPFVLVMTESEPP